MKMRKLLAIFVAAAFFVPTISAFEDVDRASIDRLVERGVITNSKFFRPNEKCARGDFVEWALKNVGQNGDKKATEPFFDISEKNKYFPFVAEAWGLGVLDDAKVFLPQNGITKFDAIKIALLLEGVSIPRGNFKKADRFSDLENSEKSIVQKALEMRIAPEKSRNIFGADEKLSRIECVKILDAIALRRASENLLYLKNSQKNGEHILEKIQNLIEKKYLRKDKIDSEQILEAAADAMVGALDDPHSVYFTAEETNSFLTGVGFGTEYGVGAQVGVNDDDAVIIMKPLRNGPAENAGVRSGDIVSKVDGVDVLTPKLSLEEVVKKIKGKNGTSVEIEFLRRGKPIVKKIIRGPIVLESLFAFPHGKYLVVQIDFFGGTTVSDFKNAIEKYENSAKNGIILDLRNDPGGLLQTAIDFLGEVLPPKSVAVKTRSVDVEHTQWTAGSGQFSEIPMVILMNEFSASASEIVAGAAQDHGRAAVIGTQSFGKGTAQDLLRFDDGSALKLTISEWLTPDGRAIDGVGIAPDFSFSSVDDDEKVFEYAEKILKRGNWKTKK